MTFPFCLCGVRAELLCSVAWSWPPALQPTRFLCPWDFPDKNSGLGCNFFSRGSSWPKDQTHVPGISCTSRWILCLFVFLQISIDLCSPFRRLKMPPAQCLFFQLFILFWMINNVELVSGVQQSDSVIHMHVSILSQILLRLRWFHNIEQSFLPCSVSWL